jgi:hypothetical protein
MSLLTPQHIAAEIQAGLVKKLSSEPKSKFPTRLRKMLDDAEENDFSHVVSWNSEGGSFKVHDPMVFADDVMPTYFNQTKYKSFQRQLNLYGFVRIHQGYHKASYSNENFRRDDLSISPLPRHKVIRGYAKNLSSTTPLLARSNSFASSMSTIDLQDRIMLDFGAEPISSGWDSADKNIDATFAEQPAFASVCSSLSEEVQLFVKDLFKTEAIAVDAGDIPNDFPNDPLFQSMMNDPILLSLDTNKSDLDVDIAEEKKLKASTRAQTEHSFPWKLHDMLEEADRHNFSHIVSWEPGGVSFQVHKGDEFFTKIMPLYFDQTKYDSFRRQLDIYSFSRVAQWGSYSGIYSHASLVQGDRSLCKEIKRRQ